MSNFQTYQQSKARVEAKSGDERDALIVALWEKAAKLVEERNQLRADQAQSEHEIDGLNRKVRRLTHDVEVLESRVSRATEGPLTLAKIVQDALAGGDDSTAVLQ